MEGPIHVCDILCHPVATIRDFGWRTFLRAIFAGRRRTFVSMCQGSPQDAEPAAIPETLKRCIDLELSSQRIYRSLARTFANIPPLTRFFIDLAEQEHDHADLLRMCWAAARRDGWDVKQSTAWQQHIEPLEHKMETIEASLPEISTIGKAARLVVDIESSEINSVFTAVVATCPSKFVEKLQPFQKAIETHISYIVMELSYLAPQTLSESRELWAKLPQTG
jgi:rubrerythrin